MAKSVIVEPAVFQVLASAQIHHPYLACQETTSTVEPATTLVALALIVLAERVSVQITLSLPLSRLLTPTAVRAKILVSSVRLAVVVASVFAVMEEMLLLPPARTPTAVNAV